MHNGTVADGNNWMSHNLPTILNSAEYKNGSTVVLGLAASATTMTKAFNL